MWWFILFFALLIPLAAVVLDSQLGRALAALVERWGRGAVEAIPDRRIAILEGELERVARELQRLEEQTDFLQRLLTERSPASGVLESGDSGE